MAIDLPGFGKSFGSRNAIPTDLISRLTSYFGLESPVVFAPSYSGRFVWPAMATSDLLSGAVVVAPVGVEEQNLEIVKQFPKPLLIIWGTADRQFSLSLADDLENAAQQGTKVLLEGAGHPAYIDKTKGFHDAVISWLRKLPPRQRRVNASDL